MKQITKNIQRAMMRVFLLLLTAFVAVSNLNAQEVTIDGLVYRLSEDGATVLHVEDGNTSKTINVPGIISYDGTDYKVNTIGEYAFLQNNNIEEIYAPACNYIGNLAFCSCSSLKKIVIPECITIGVGSFSGCKSLEVVSLPKCETIEGVKGSEFRFVVQKNNVIRLILRGIETGAFSGCSKLREVILPNCTHIGHAAFADCTSIKEINIPNCNYIGFSSFYGCTKLGIVSFPKCITIEDGDYDNNIYSKPGAFQKCSNLKEVALPKCPIIGNYAFCGCKNLRSIGFDERK